jgi:hypothetical protein
LFSKNESLWQSVGLLALPLLVDAAALALQALEAASTNSPCLLPRRCLVYLADKESRQTPHKHKSEEGDAAVVESCAFEARGRFVLPGPAFTDKACCGSGASPTDTQKGRQARAG